MEEGRGKKGRGEKGEGFLPNIIRRTETLRMEVEMRWRDGNGLGLDSFTYIKNKGTLFADLGT